MPRKTDGNATERDIDIDRYPKLVNVARALAESPDLGDVEIYRLEIGCLANGEAVARYLEVGSETWEGVNLGEF